MKHLFLYLTLLSLSVGFFLAGGCQREPNKPPERRTPPKTRKPERLTYSEGRKPCKDYDVLKRPMFGDLHVHGGDSFDAWSYYTKATPKEIYDFAQGKPMDIPPFAANGKGRTVRLSRPLDFTALTEHAEFLGEVNLCRTPGNPAYKTNACSRYRKRDSNSVILFGVQLTKEDPVPKRIPEICGADGKLCVEMAKKRWALIRQAAQESYDQTEGCKFVTFVGYEYATTPGLSNVHRNVIFRNNTVPDAPISFYEQPSPYGLWLALKQQCLDPKKGCDVMTIGHNSNLSNGRMFQSRYPKDSVFGGERSAAMLRARLEPIIEIVQHKGSMECRNGFAGVDDTYCTFEKLRPDPVKACAKGETGSLGMRLGGCLSPLDFVRHIFGVGLQEKLRLGSNPYQMGVIGATDTHNGLAGYTEEYNYMGHIGTVDDSPLKQLSKGNITHDGFINNPGGLAVVWAEERSRDAIFNGLQRRETYATSGTRISLRMFGGWEYRDSLCDAGDRELAQEGYDKGVPMGGILKPAPAGAKAPVFVVMAKQDLGTSKHPGIPLQQIQIVKGWVDADGKSQEKVFAVAGNPNNGASVDVKTCKRSGQGEKRLCARWTDPDFDPKRPAFYYARVLENPSCRWSTYKCNSIAADKRPGVCSDPKTPKVIQERAWSSPIWYQK